jgi:uncharacterized membrane protein YhhN
VNGPAILLLAVFGAVAVLDWVAVQRRSKPLEYLAKPGCMVALVGAAVVLDPVEPSAQPWLVVALVLSLLGDVFLMLPGRQPGSTGPDLFVAGLGSFLLAHLAYVAAFWIDGVDGAGLLVGAVLVVLLVGVVGRRVVAAVRASDEPGLAAPVTAYVAVISAMVASAAGTGDPRALVGAALFAGSDSLIAWDRFVRARPWAPMAIIVTYHLAQALLVVSFT